VDEINCAVSKGFPWRETIIKAKLLFCEETLVRRFCNLSIAISTKDHIKKTKKTTKNKNATTDKNGS